MADLDGHNRTALGSVKGLDQIFSYSHEYLPVKNSAKLQERGQTLRIHLDPKCTPGNEGRIDRRLVREARSVANGQSGGTGSNWAALVKRVFEVDPLARIIHEPGIWRQSVS